MCCALHGMILRPCPDNGCWCPAPADASEADRAAWQQGLTVAGAAAAAAAAATAAADARKAKAAAAAAAADGKAINDASDSTAAPQVPAGAPVEADCLAWHALTHPDPKVLALVSCAGSVLYVMQSSRQLVQGTLDLQVIRWQWLK